MSPIEQLATLRSTIANLRLLGSGLDRRAAGVRRAVACELRVRRRRVFNLVVLLKGSATLKLWRTPPLVKIGDIG